MEWQQGGMPTRSAAEQRAHTRHKITRAAVLHYAGTQIPVVLQDMSKSGARIALPPTRKADTLQGPMHVDIPGVMRMRIERKWGTATTMGVAFEPPAPRKAMLEVQIQRLLRAAPR